MGNNQDIIQISFGIDRELVSSAGINTDQDPRYHGYHSYHYEFF